jgi:hypothetical protein
MSQGHKANGGSANPEIRSLPRNPSVRHFILQRDYFYKNCPEVVYWAGKYKVIHGLI